MLNQTVARVLKRLHYPLDVMLTYVRWYVAYPLSLRHLEEIMSERGISVDHSTVHRWAMKLLPVLEKVFRLRKRTVGKSWRMDSDSFGGHLWIPASWIEGKRPSNRMVDRVQWLSGVTSIGWWPLRWG